MYTRKRIIEEINRLYEAIDITQDKLLAARVEKDSEKESEALHQMERLAIGVQQDLTVIRDYLEAHPSAQDIERIVNLADDLITEAKIREWSEEEYYTKILEEYENQNQKTH